MLRELEKENVPGIPEAEGQRSLLQPPTHPTTPVLPPSCIYRLCVLCFLIVLPFKTVLQDTVKGTFYSYRPGHLGLLPQNFVTSHKPQQVTPQEPHLFEFLEICV